MKKNILKRRTLLSLTSLLLVGTTSLTVLACSNQEEEEKLPYVDLSDSSISELNRDVVSPNFLVNLREFAKSEGLTKKDIDSITIDDLHKFAVKNNDLDKKKMEIIEKAKKIITRYAFKNNKNGEWMTGLQSWINNANLQVFTSQSPGRGPWITDPKQGAKSYYRHKLINMRAVRDFGDLDLYGSTFTQKAIDEDAVKKVVRYNIFPSLDKGDRVNDPSFSTGNHFSTARGSATSFSLFRSIKSGNYESTTNKETGDITFTSKEEERIRLFPGLDLSVDGKKITTTNTDNLINFEEAEKQVQGKSGKVTLTFKNNSASVNYSQAQNGNVVDSKVKFQAKDLFYGLVRSFYASSSFRKDGKLNEEDLSAYLTTPTDTEKQMFNDLFENKAAAEAYNNGNLYLLDLYGVDVPETLKENFASTNDSEFILKFKDFSPTSLYMFKNNTSIAPFPKSKLVNVSGNPTSLSMTNLNIFYDYGNPYAGEGDINVDGYLSIAPFIFTNYTTTAGETQVVKRNRFYIDQDWVNNEKSIETYEAIVKSKGADANAYATQRVKGFKYAKTTGEYTLDQAIFNFKSEMDKLTEYQVIKETRSNGVSGGSKLFWNFAGYNEENFNDKAREMLWGNSDASMISSDANAMREFFSGQGATVRSTIKASINFYTMAQSLFPGLNMTFYPNNALKDEFDISNVDEKLVYPAWSQNINGLEDIYNSNLGNWKKAWITRNYVSAAKTLDEIAKRVGATEEDPAQIPIFKYIFEGDPGTPAEILTNQRILQVLNSLTPRVRFVNQKDYSWSEFVEHSYTKKDAATLLSGFGPDYQGLGSANEQFLTYYSSVGFAGLLQDAFSREENVLQISDPDLNSAITFSGTDGSGSVSITDKSSVGYTITLTSGGTNGSLSNGDKLTFTVTPNEGYVHGYTKKKFNKAVSGLS